MVCDLAVGVLLRQHNYSIIICAVVVGLEYGSYTVSESTHEVEVCIEVKSGNLAQSESVVVTITTSPGTAIGNSYI